MNAHLYLDIDGVLNAYERGVIKAPSLWEGGYRRHGWEWVAPAMVARLNGLIAEHGIVCHWLTTWERGAGAFGKLIGLAGSEHWPWLPALSGIGADWPKFTSIREHVAENKPDLAFWFDDDLATEPDAVDWVDTQSNVYAYAPTGAHGITPRMLDHVESLLGSHH